MYPIVVGVIETIMEDGIAPEQWEEARVLLQMLETFEFALC